MDSHSQAHQAISAALDRLERDQALFRPENFVERTRAMDVLELQMPEGVEQANDTELTDAEASRLRQRAEALRQRWAGANERLFAHLLASIRSNDHSTIRQYLREVERQVSRSAQEGDLGYDELDMLVNGLLEVASVPAEPEALEADMVAYQPTPARILLRLVDELRPTPDDTFYDLGSGLGHVPILVHLLAGIQTRGIELEASYIRYSNEWLKKLGLANVEVIQADARQADYADGTIFYLYTPFRGEMLRQVLGRLEAQAERRRITVCTYGPCTLEVSEARWLRAVYRAGQGEGCLGVFSSS
jgi:Histone methylation protein DOT1